jgi:transcriptional regulator with XRE-family HTH domain
VPRKTQRSYRAYHPVLARIGKRIRAARKDGGWTQESLALEVEMNPVYLSEVERGIKNVSVLTLVKIARALRVEVSTFFG